MGAINPRSDEVQGWSNSGINIVILAPGVDVVSVGIASPWVSMSGTSMGMFFLVPIFLPDLSLLASPHVAGLAAYLLALCDTVKTPDDIRTRIQALARASPHWQEGRPLIAWNGACRTRDCVEIGSPC